MSEAETNIYQLTSMEEPGDKCMAQIMCEDARESTRGVRYALSNEAIFSIQ
ncbi:MAG: hypothetical protein K2L78_03080 [Muribaculaceae bacterium]|nr:hypothetical protein [Muribaculaceae bacterium]